MLKKTFLYFTILAVCTFFSLSLTAEETAATGPDHDESMFTEEVEVVGNVPVIKTIQSVSLFKQEDIAKFNFENLKSVLQLTPGVLTLSNGSFGQSSSTSIRGSKTAQVLYIVDGVKLRDGAGTSGVNLSAISPFLVDKIEVVRGPLSSIYGSDAMGGVININTTSREGANFIGSFGNYNSYSGGFSGATNLNNFTIGASINTQRFSDNIENDEYKNTGISSKILYKSKKIETGLQYFGNYTNSGIPKDDSGFPSPERKYKQNYSVLSLPFTYHISDSGSLDAKFSYSNSRYIFNDVEDIWSPYFKSDFDNKEAEITYSGHYFKKLNLRAGIDYSSQKILNEDLYGKSLDNLSTDYFSSFIFSSLNLDPVQLTASIRYDKYKDVDSNVSPQIGISYLLNNKFKLRASYSHSFLAPFLSQQVNPWGNPNFDLKPEKGKSFEVGAEFYSAPATFSATYFNTKFENMIDWVTVDWVYYIGQFRNVKNVDTSGVELAFSVYPVHVLNISGAYTYLHTKDLETGKQIARKPKHAFTAFVAYVDKRFNLSLNMIYVGKRPDLNYNIYPPDITLPAHTIFDLNLVIPVLKGLDVFGKLTNIFDKDYQEISGYPSPGRRFELGFKYRVK